MSKYLFFSIVIVLTGPFSVPAQSLGFSQVIIVSTSEDTVPAGKVWKIDAYVQGNISVTNNTQQGACTALGYHHPFYVDNVPIYSFDGIATGSTITIMGPGNKMPIWLPEGKRVRTDCIDDFLSIIEFNVVP